MRGAADDASHRPRRSTQRRSVNHETRTAVRHHRTIAADCERAAAWLDDLAAGRPVDDTGPVPLELARHLPPRLLHRWANNERANRVKHLTAANDLIIGRTP